MSIEIKVPVLPESISEATIANWYKKPGEPVKQDEHLVDIETDKVVLEVVAPEDGALESIKRQKGETVKAEEVIALFKPGKISKTETEKKEGSAEKSEEKSKPASKQASPAEPKKVSKEPSEKDSKSAVVKEKQQEVEQEAENLSPSMRRRMAEKEGTAQPLQKTQSQTTPQTTATDFESGVRVEKRVPMTRLRARIAERLLQAQHNAAILTTFNEINMQPVMTLRQRYKETFEKTYGVRLGFMSFFTMAVIEALKHFPVINASIDGNDIVYHGYFDIGIAVSTPRGLVVPVLRNAESLTMAEIEKQIIEYSQKAKDGRLSIEEITGGTFTITNGGVFGSLMATPILNPPQSGILGMHKIQDRVVVENGQMIIRPMMYVALSYDHRIVDGADSVRFLVTIKELLEEPARLALGI